MHIENGLYKTILSCLPIACVDVAVMSHGGVLLVKRGDMPAKGEWWLPGGRVHKGEMMRDAAVRKAREEVGLDCWIGPLVHTAETIFPDGPHGESVHSINSCFMLFPKRDTDTPALDGHHTNYKWVYHIEGGLAQYVKDCLAKCGLESRI